MVMRQESGLSCVALTGERCLRQQRFENELGEFLVFPARWIFVATLFDCCDCLLLVAGRCFGMQAASE